MLSPTLVDSGMRTCRNDRSECCVNFLFIPSNKTVSLSPFTLPTSKRLGV